MQRPLKIFICGIAGVGKSFLLSRVRDLKPEAEIYRASEIIGLARENLDGEFLRNFPHDELESSQRLLVAGFNLRMQSCTAPLVLLDGHSVIDNDYGMFPIPSSVMSAIQLNLIFHIEDDVHRIHERRLRDSSRRRPVRTPEQLAAYQRLSLSTCEEISRALAIPLVRVQGADVTALNRELDNLLSPRHEVP